MNKILQNTHLFITSLNSNKYFAGLIMIIMNVFSKYITLEVSKTQESYLKANFARQILIFSLCWSATRDIYTAFLLTAAFIIMSDFLFNENSNMCIIPHQFRKFEEILDSNKDNRVSDKEIQEAIAILEKARKKEERRKQMQMVHNFEMSKNNDFIF